MPERLHPADLELLADLIADRILAGGTVSPDASELVDAAKVARRFGVSVEWVRDHADELGVVRLGDGPRPRLRFDLEQVRRAMAARQTSDDSPPPPEPASPPVHARRRRRGATADAQLLPIRGGEA